MLIESLAAALGAPPEVVRPGRHPARRVGLALDPWPGLADWARADALDAVVLHRHWRWDPAGWPDGVALLASHDPFDRRYAFGVVPELTTLLSLTPGPLIAERDGWPLGTVGAGAARSVAALRAALVDAFGGVDGEVAGADVPATRVAMARAMTPELVEGAARLGATVYVTGQVRERAVGTARRVGMHVLAVGHARSERWALGLLAGALRAALPAVAVRLAPDDAPG
ncbi:Nif3-like dinuclear metal center hexameric protein [Roseisolibacter sp. H3M3-2]|uniref:Nif3-like dinuclear metal center hexameric protein n=1 Tax=Roseisolibacter sp. H3M3-2 TaxID=3031323 RepID=UPI0023DB7876|nr:Nif3-like dinuclear metal center hexameric protein [Roseisolibacter sp. H3M3-2]MDF1504120.1 Nif3-like dinuclear metal center hexameric protein [Roseisolibacter sp. H3M3-2]